MKYIVILVVFLSLIKINSSFECYYQCKTCDTQDYKCDECLDEGIDSYDGKRNKTDACSCPEGYRDEPNEEGTALQPKCVLDCPHQCADCLAGSKSGDQKCKVCKDDNMLLPHCYYQKEGNFVVEDGQGNISYEQCNIKCLNCKDTADNCQIINGASKKCNGNNRQENATGDQLCNCLEGYYDNEGKLQDCERCPDDCVTCLYYNRCKSCDASNNKELNKFTGACDCKRGYDIFVRGGECQKCYMLSDVCVQQCPQNTVQNEELQVCETLEYKMISNSTLILILGILIGVIQISMCCFVYVCLQRKHDSMERLLFDDQMKIKQQRDHIYKNLDNYQSQSVDLSKAGTQAIKKSSNSINEESQVSSNNLHSQINLFNNQSQINESQVNEITEDNKPGSKQGTRFKRNQ